MASSAPAPRPTSGTEPAPCGTAGRAHRHRRRRGHRCGLRRRSASPPGAAGRAMRRRCFPAGVALVAALIYGRAALLGVLIGSFAVNLSVGALRARSGWRRLAPPLAIGAGAALQAWAGALAGAALGLAAAGAERAARHSPVHACWGRALACVISPSIATPALLAAAHAGPRGVGVELADLVGRRRAGRADRRHRWPDDGRPPEPPGAATPDGGRADAAGAALLAVGMVEFGRVDRQRLQAAFERDADRMMAEAQRAAERAAACPAGAAQRRPRAGRARPRVAAPAARWWLAQPTRLQAPATASASLSTGWPPSRRARGPQGAPGYRVFERAGGAARSKDHEVVALRHIEPAAGNAAALGVNALSVPAARERRSWPRATAASRRQPPAFG